MHMIAYILKPAVKNKNGLCSFHSHLLECPCPKHNRSNDMNKIKYKNEKLRDLLYEIDVGEVIYNILPI